MKILYASQRPPYPFFLGGAARSAHNILQALSRQPGITCMAVGSAGYSVSPWEIPSPENFASLGITSMTRSEANSTLDCGYPVDVISPFEERLSKLIDSDQPDIVWGQMEGTLDIFRISCAKAVQGIFFVRDAEFDHRELKQIARLGVHFVCNSRFLAKRVKQVTGKHASVVYPSLSVDYTVRGDVQGCITMINPHPVKGLQTFLAIAKQLPTEKFLLLESWPLSNTLYDQLNTALQQLPNVTFQRRVSDMAAIYSQTKLLLVPSIWEEAFGRVVIEAQSCGIPVIASARGGLPEAVGDGGILIDDYQNAAHWASEIKHLLASPEEYAGLAKRASINARREAFSADFSAQRFAEICTMLIEKAEQTHSVATVARNWLNRIPLFRNL